MRDTSFVSPANPARLECHDLGPVRNPLDQFTENLPGVYVRPLDSLELTGKIMASKQLTRSIHYMLGTGLTLAARDPEKYVLQILETLTFVQNPIILPSPPLRHVILCGPQTCELDRRKNFLEHGLSTLYTVRSSEDLSSWKAVNQESPCLAAPGVRYPVCRQGRGRHDPSRSYPG